MKNENSAHDTFPKLLLRQAEIRGKKTASRRKEFGIWKTWNWATVSEEVRYLACGLKVKDFKRGENIAIMGENANLYWAATAAQCLGGVVVPIHLEATEDELIYILNHTKSRFILVDDQAQVDILLEIKNQCPNLVKVIFVNPIGMKFYTDPCLSSFDFIRQKGVEYDEENKDFFVDQIAQGDGEDTAFIFYTAEKSLAWGTSITQIFTHTGEPTVPSLPLKGEMTDEKFKGVMLSHKGLISAASSSVSELGLNPGDGIIAFLPLSIGASILFYYAQPYVAGFCVNFPENNETVVTDMREIGPTVCFATPNVYKSLLNLIMLRMDEAGKIKRYLFNYFRQIAFEAGANGNSRKSGSFWRRVLRRIGKQIFFEPLKNMFGLKRIRVALTTGNPISPETLGFYQSLGVNLKQFYGPPEGSFFVSVQRDGQITFDSVGFATKDVEIKIAEEGEVLFKGPNVFKGYYGKSDNNTAKDPEGWTKTGDTGLIDENEELFVFGAMEDYCKLTDGTDMSPTVVESMLKSFLYIKEAVVFGHGRPFAVAFISIDGKSVSRWADRQDIIFSGYAELSQQEEVYDLIRSCVESINSELCDAGQGGALINRFLILPKEIDSSELSPDGKLNRNVIVVKYIELINSLYAGKDRYVLDAESNTNGSQTQLASTEIKISDARAWCRLHDDVIEVSPSFGSRKKKSENDRW